MMKFYENQETMNPIDSIKTSTSNRVARIEAFLQNVSNQLGSEGIEDVHELSAMGAAQVVLNEGFSEHIHCANVLKKRRARMRRHKHKKRLRKNRFKQKK
jgi:prophage maintenance system killer protein